MKEENKGIDVIFNCSQCKLEQDFKAIMNINVGNDDEHIGTICPNCKDYTKVRVGFKGVTPLHPELPIGSKEPEVKE